MSRDYIATPLDQAQKVEAMLRVMSMAIDGEQICATSFADNGWGCLIDMAIETMCDLIEKIAVLERVVSKQTSTETSATVQAFYCWRVFGRIAMRPAYS